MAPFASAPFDVAIVGGGPGGATCAALCASAGLRTVLLERTRFPRDKVCGDCLNPAAWPVLDRLGVGEKVRGLVHARLGAVDFVGCDDRILTYAMPDTSIPEIAVRRRDLDEVLLQSARQCGVEVREESAVTSVRRLEGAEPLKWEIATSTGTVRSRYLVAADGRNSTVLRALGLYPPTRRDRAGLQTHLPRPADMKDRVRMRFRPEGYCGLADIGGGEANLCLVARPERLDSLKEWARGEFQLPPEQTWRAITPLSREPVSARQDDLLLVGDTARVVEPFTGEGIYYAMASGELAANALASGALDRYRTDHAALYRGRLWINRLAKAACLYPGMATHLLRLSRVHPGMLGMITRKIVNG
jgi:geranylgeranyl reductase family protein